MRDLLAVVGLLALLSWGLCRVGLVTPAELAALARAIVAQVTQ